MSAIDYHETKTSLRSTFHFLRKLSSPNSIIHIGAGNGEGDIHEWRKWDIVNALIIDVDPSRLTWAECFPQWKTLVAVLAEDNDEADFYSASNASENGLLSPEYLRALWPNLKTTHKELCQTTRLDKLVTNEITYPLWMLIDCLPALSILKGAEKLLPQCSVICLRVLLTALPEVPKDTLFSSIEQYLQPLGFKCLEVVENNHPALAHAIFVKDWRNTLQPKVDALLQQASVLTTQCDASEKKLTEVTFAKNEETKLASERQQQIEQLTKVLDEQAQLANQHKATLDKLTAEHKTQVDQLSTERDTQAKTAAERQQQIEQLTKARDEQTELANQHKATLDKQTADHKAQLEQLTADRDTQTKTVAERQQQIEQLTKARDEQTQLANQHKATLDKLTAEHKTQVDQLSTERDTQAKTAAERQEQIEQLTKARDEQTELANQHKATLDKQTAEHIAELEQLTAERDTQAKTAAERHQQIEQLTKAHDQAQQNTLQKEKALQELEAQHNETQARQQLLQKELIKAEAQIELIKDLLLREPGI